MSQTYVPLEVYKSHAVGNVTSSVDDWRMLKDLEAHSRQLERLLGGRQFFPTVDTRYFSGDGSACLAFPAWDLLSISSLKEDTDRDGTYETTWASTDYLLSPNRNDPTSFIDPKPYWLLEVDQRSSGSQDVWLKGQRMYELTGSFGYCNLTESTGAAINEGAEYSSSDTTLTVDDGSLVNVGDTLLIDSEQIYVVGKPVEGGNDLTVRRGMNGTTAAAHDDSTAISRYVYPENVVKAVLLQARRLHIRATGGYADQVGFDATGAMTPQVGVDQDFWQLVEKYKRHGVY